MSGLVSPEDIEDIGFAGASWLTENIVFFDNKTCLTLLKRVGRGTTFALKLSAFGDVGWWDDSGQPTADIYLNRIPEHVVRGSDGRAHKILLDMSNEGQVFYEPWVALLFNGLIRRNIDPTQCVLLQQNRVFKAKMDQWALEQSVSPFQVAVYDHFPRSIAGLLARQSNDFAINLDVRPKRFCCLNFTPRANRVSFVSWLLACGFDRFGYISFSNFKHMKMETEEPVLAEWFPEIETIRRGLGLLQGRVPMLLDLEEDVTAVPEFDLGPTTIFRDSYFSIVTESEVSDGSLIRITEKCLKPLAMGHPILVVGNPGSLALLRQYGFETFHPYIDETYDTVEDPVQRIQLLFGEVVRLMEIDHLQLHSLYRDMNHIIKRNIDVARSRMNTYFRDTVEVEIVRDMLI